MNTVEAVPAKADAPTIEIAAHAGTCYGVQRALDMALAAAPQAGETAQVHTLGPLIHNPIVVRELAEAGVGLAETLVALTGKHHGESEESQKLGLRIVEHMRKRCDDEAAKTHLNFTLIATPAEGLSGRFVALDRKKYGVIKGVTDREYYTNSFHVPVYFPIKAFRKIELEAPYHSFTNAGHITYVELDGDTCKNLEAFETIIRFMHDKGVGYGSINHPLDRDPVCGYVGVINGQCPRCGRKEGEAVSQETLKMLRRKYPHMPNCCR